MMAMGDGTDERPMDRADWSAREKKIARRAFEEALERALTELVADFKARAAAATTPADVWAIEAHLRQQRRELDELFDYRYSQLVFVFAKLLARGLLAEERLSGLSEENLELIRAMARKWVR
jgi:hypothetical protein